MGSCSWPIWKDFLSSTYIEKNKTDGGLRKQNKLKTSTHKEPLISYVTVVRNNEKDIKRVIESVQKQTYKNVEHIILDGASTDNTFTIIKEYENVLDYFASEPDKGLYDALNKVIPLCKGALICVLNSDDWLPENAAEIVVRNYQNTEKELILGAAKVYLSDNNQSVWKPSKVSLNSYFSIANACHNAMYATKGCYEVSGPYDITMKIAADFKWIMKCFDRNVRFIYTDDITVNYSLGGISSDSKKHIEESKEIIREKFPFLTNYEIETLNYIYYPWRDELEHSSYKLFRCEPFIEEILEKYKEYPLFINAISMDNYNINESIYHNLKSYIRKHFPHTFNQLKRIINLFRNLKK